MSFIITPCLSLETEPLSVPRADLSNLSIPFTALLHRCCGFERWPPCLCAGALTYGAISPGSIQEEKNGGLKDGSISKVLGAQAGGPEFDPQTSIKELGT